ncbi:MAG: hypothetical protein ABIF40_04195 [archaeon]
MSKYYAYLEKNSLVNFVGNTKDQILNTLQYYKEDRNVSELEIPCSDEIKRVHSSNPIVIRCVQPCSIETYIDVKINENIHFKVNPGMYIDVITQAANYQLVKRGDLYKFDSGLGPWKIWLLSEDVMQSLNDYDWEQHQKFVEEILSINEKGFHRAGFVHTADLNKKKELIH